MLYSFTNIGSFIGNGDFIGSSLKQFFVAVRFLSIAAKIDQSCLLVLSLVFNFEFTGNRTEIEVE